MHCCASQCGGLATACNKGPHNRSITPFPPVGWEENRTKKAKFVGWDKGSLIEQQRKRTVTATVLIKRIYKTSENTGQLSHCLMPSALPRAIHLPPARSLTSHRAWWHVVSNTPLVWPVWVSHPGCVPSRLLVRINTTLAVPRTHRDCKKKTDTCSGKVLTI